MTLAVRSQPSSRDAVPAGSTLAVDLDALAANWTLLDTLAGHAECAAVVKADAYGLGLAAVAARLCSEGCRTFFVAQANEGVALRSLLPEAIVYVLSGLPPGAAAAFGRARLRPVLGSLAEVEDWASEGDGAPCAVQLDTGMSRLGIPAALWSTAARATARLDVALVLSHLAFADRAASAVAIAHQIERFAQARRHWPGVPGSLANSGGIFLGAAARHDLVRPGYALCGGNPLPGEANPMRGVVAFTATILQVAEVSAGTGVGYDALWTAPSARRLATLDAGYADGVPCSALGDDGAVRGVAAVAGVLCPIVGRISMDLTVVDVSDAPPVARGDVVELVGPAIPIDEAAGRAGTIGYEILTRLGQRSRRVFLGRRFAAPRPRVL